MPQLGHFQTYLAILKHLDESKCTPAENSSHVQISLADVSIQKAAEAAIETLHTQHSKDLTMGVMATIQSLEVVLPLVEKTLKATFPGRDPKKRFLRFVKILLADETYIQHVDNFVREAHTDNSDFNAFMRTSFGHRVHLTVEFVSRLKEIKLDDNIMGPGTDGYMEQVNINARDLFAGFVQPRILTAGAKVIDAMIYALPRELSDVRKAEAAAQFRNLPYIALRMLQSEETRCFDEMQQQQQQEPPPDDYRLSTGWLTSYFEGEEFDLHTWARRKLQRIHVGRAADILVTIGRKLAARCIAHGTEEAKEHWSVEYGDDLEAVLDEVVKHAKRVKAYLLSARY